MVSDIFQSCCDYDKGCVLSTKRGRRSGCEQACELAIVIWAAALFFGRTLLMLKSNTRWNFVFYSKEFILINVIVCIFWSSQSHTWTQTKHEICQKLYTAGFSGQKFDTLHFTVVQQFWWKTSQELRMLSRSLSYCLSLSLSVSKSKSLSL